jgi:hypothetical protein
MFRSILLAMAAVCALAAIPAASASAALPEFEKPEKGFPNSFTSKQTNTTYVETVGGAIVGCQGKESTSTGSITGAKTLAVSSGRLAVNEPEGTLGYAGKPHVAIKLTPKGGGSFAGELKCPTERGEFRVHARGSLFCELTPINTTTTKFTLACRIGLGRGVEAIRAFDGETEKEPFETEARWFFGEAWSWQQSNLEATMEITTAKVTKINA